MRTILFVLVIMMLFSGSCTRQETPKSSKELLTFDDTNEVGFNEELSKQLFEINDEGECNYYNGGFIIGELEKINTPKTKEILSKFVKTDKNKNDMILDLKRRAFEALIRMDENLAYTLAIDVLSDKTNLFRDTVASYLSRFCRKDAIPYLLKAYEDTNDFSTHDESFYSLLELGYKFSDIEIKQELKSANMKDEEEKDEELKDRADFIIIALGESGHLEYIPLIEPYLKSDNKRTRELAEESIHILKGELKLHNSCFQTK